ncbi:MAG: hypothetical protein AzoDbin1_03894 [Azoarcus sp.]|nr:hypothetical protein [Azoarcus sp.]
MTPTPQSVTPHASPSSRAEAGVGRGRPDLGAVLADGALPVPVAVTREDDLLAGLEARLADGMRDLASALLKFSGITQAVHKELPLGSEFGKHITLLLGSVSLQLAYALLKDGDLPLLLDDGAQHLHKLGLSVDELFRELDVDGRRFLTVALVEQQSPQVFQHREAGPGASNP